MATFTGPKPQEWDHLGPGGFVWNRWSKALLAAKLAHEGCPLKGHNTYAHHKGEMRAALKRHGASQATIDEWTEALEQRVADKDWEDD